MANDFGDEALEQSDTGLEDDGELDPTETLLSDPADRDPEQGPVDAPDRYRAVTAFGTTRQEERAGQSLDALLRQEEPELSDDAGFGPDEQYEAGGPGDDLELDSEGDAQGPDGVLTAIDGDFGPELNEEQIARRVGKEGTAAAEDAAIHLTTPP